MTETAVPYHQLATVTLREKLAKNEALWPHYSHPGNAPTSAHGRPGRSLGLWRDRYDFGDGDLDGARNE